MCEHCENGTQYCPECGRMVCDDMEYGGDDVIASPFVTRRGDWMCYFCGISTERELQRFEDEEAEEYGWDFMYPASWYDADVPVPDDEEPTHKYIGPDDKRLG